MKHIVQLILFVLLATSTLYASDETERIESYITAMRDGDINAIALMTDPTDLKTFRSILAYFDTRTDNAFGEKLRTSFFGTDATLESTKEKSDADIYAAWITFGRSVILALTGDLLHGDHTIMGYVAENDTHHYIVRFTAIMPEVKGYNEFTELGVVSLRVGSDGKSWIRITENIFRSVKSIMIEIPEG